MLPVRVMFAFQARDANVHLQQHVHLQQRELNGFAKARLQAAASDSRFHGSILADTFSPVNGSVVIFGIRVSCRNCCSHAPAA